MRGGNKQKYLDIAVHRPERELWKKWVQPTGKEKNGRCEEGRYAKSGSMKQNIKR